MPGPSDLTRGGLTPFEVAAAYRKIHPTLFDGVDDFTLIQSIKTKDPDTYKLIDPMLEGAEALSPGSRGSYLPPPPPNPATLPTAPKANPVISTGLRVGGGLIGGSAGFLAGGPLGAMAGGAAGSTAGETAAQWYEKEAGEREAMSVPAILLEGGLGAVNPGLRGSTTAARLGWQALYGSGLGAAGNALRPPVEEGRFPTAGEVAMGAGVGATLGVGFGGVAEGVRAAHGATSFTGDLTGGLPIDGPPPALATPDLAPIQAAASAMYQQEESRLAQELVKAFGPDAVRPPGAPDHHTTLLAKNYLHRIAQLTDEEKALASTLQPPPSGIEEVGPPVLNGPPPLPPSRQLPERAGLGSQAPPTAFRAYPPDVDPTESLDVVGSPPPRIIAGRHPIEAQLEESLLNSGEPGPPRLGGRQLRLTPPTVEPDVPRETFTLGSPPRRPTTGPIAQLPRLGGRRATTEQPRLPGSDQPVPVDRTYASGPNAGPRRPTEAHGTPRRASRMVDTPAGRKREDYDTPLKAEDPGTYPPEVRRELAAMAWELEQFPHYNEPGGIAPEQVAAVQRELNSDVSTAIAELRRRGASSGGAVAGAPVYHEVIAAAKGPYAHISRAAMLQQLRAALLEGKGSGISDAAAQVARGRLRQRQTPREQLPRRYVDEDPNLLGGPRREVVGLHELRATRGDEGDQIIAWVDEDGARTIPDGELDEVARAVREAETGELLAAHRMRQEAGDDLTPESLDYFDAATDELVRRGVILPQQPGLVMEAPGGAKGPSLFDFEGGPPPKKPAAAEQPSLPGAEGVREQNIPTPEVADLPFALTPPPSKPTASELQARMAKRRQGGLFERLKGEEGVIIFDVPAGDRAGYRKWLAKQEPVEGGETWFSRAEQAVEDGDWDKAWKIAAAASARSYAKAYAATRTGQEERRLASEVRGTPLQSDIGAEIIGGARQRAGVGDAPPVKDFPPSARVTQAGAARGKATLGPAGIMNPGPRQRPLSTAAPALRAATLDREVVRLLVEGIESPEGLSTIPGNTDTYLRLFRQVGEQIYRGQNLKLLREAGVRIPPEELAQHFNATISDAGRTLNLLKQFATTHKESLQAAAEMQSMGGALAGVLGGPPPKYVGAGGREMTPAGRKVLDDVITQLEKDTSSYQAAALANDMQKRKPTSTLQALHDASYAWMLSKWNTALRNYVSFTGRYGTDALDHALTIPIAKVLGDEPTARVSSAMLRERGIQPMGMRGTSVTPKRVWGDTLGEIYNFTTDSLNTLKPNDARRSLRLLLDLPEQAAEYLGTMSGEDLSQAFSNTPVVRHLVNPKVQRVLTMFNRAQEFSARATVYHASMRALLRAKGLDPTRTLQLPTPDLIQAVGGQQAFEDLSFTALSQAMEATYAGRTSKDSLPGALVRAINTVWPVKLGIPFPRFNFSAAPRFLYDHSLVGLVDWIRFPFDRAGITAAPGSAAGGRLYRGVRAEEIQQVDLPRLQAQVGAAERQQGQALQDLLTTQREWAVRQRQVKRLQARVQPGLPTTSTALQQATAARDQLARTRERLKATVQEQRGVVADLKSQQKKLLVRVADATAINAPNFSQSLARMTVGSVGLLGAAWVIRSQEGAQGTRWYEYRVDRGEGKDPVVLDFRPFAPFAQYLFVADVLDDFYKHTNWEGVRAALGTEEEGMVASPMDWSRETWAHYEGKYTAAELGAQFAQAFFSISRAAGTTLTLTDLLSNMDVPSIEEGGRALVGTIGQFFSRFTVPGQQVSDVLGEFMPEEAKVRTPPKATVEDWERPLAGPIANVPFARQLIPERISQTTGQPVAAEFPLLRALAGIGATPRDFITEEIRRIGVPGQSVFIRETGDYGLDRLVAETYSRLLQEQLPIVLEDPYYAEELDTPALQRDFLQRRFFPVVKRAALAEVRGTLGTEQFEGATVRGEEARRKARQLRLIEQLEGAEPQVTPTAGEDPGDPPIPPPPPPPGF